MYKLTLNENEIRKVSALADRLIVAFGRTDFNSETYQAAQILRDRIDAAVTDLLVQEDMRRLDEKEYERARDKLGGNK